MNQHAVSCRPLTVASAADLRLITDLEHILARSARASSALLVATRGVQHTHTHAQRSFAQPGHYALMSNQTVRCWNIERRAGGLSPPRLQARGPFKSPDLYHYQPKTESISVVLRDVLAVYSSLLVYRPSLLRPSAGVCPPLGRSTWLAAAAGHHALARLDCTRSARIWHSLSLPPPPSNCSTGDSLGCLASGRAPESITRQLCPKVCLVATV